MSSESTANYSLSYPASTDPVNVAGDIRALADDVDDFLTAPAFINNLAIDGGSLVTDAITANLFNTNATTLNIGGSATAVNIGNASGQSNFVGDVNVATGKKYEIDNVSVLTSTTLGSTVVSSSLTSVGAIETGTWNATTIAVNKGGTGLTSYAVGDIVYASASTTLAKLAGVATGNSLISSGIGVAPSWGKIGLTTHISGTLPVVNGGTGVTTSTGTGDVVLSNSPTLTGTPLSTTASIDTDTTQIATTAFVVGQGYLKTSTASTTYAPISSPIFTGTVSSTGTSLVMNSDASVGENVSFVVERGSEPDVEIRWNDVGNAWQFTNDGTTYFDIPAPAVEGSGLETALMFAGM